MRKEIFIETKKGDVYNITDTVYSISITQALEGQAGKCTITSSKLNMDIPLGSRLSVKIENYGMFKGFLFSESFSDSDTTSLVFYDQLRYWQLADNMSFKGKKLHEVFTHLCKTLNLNHKAFNTTRYVLPYKVWDNTSYFNIWKDCQDINLVNTNGFHIIRDEYGVLALREIAYTFNKNTKKIILGDDSASLGYSFTRSIDEDTYNYVKIINENNETKKRETHIVQDKNTIAEWGRLQLTEKSSDELNAAQLKQRAIDLLKLKNRITKKLSVTIEGNLDTYTLKAGDGVIIGITSLVSAKLFGRALIISDITHRFNGSSYSIDLDLMLE